MDVRGKLSFLLVACAVLTTAQVGSFFLRDKSGKNAFTNTSGIKLTQLPNSRIGFLITGNPFTFNSEGQQMTIRARKMEGTARSQSGGATLIEKGTISSIVSMVSERPSRKAGGSPQTISVNTDSVVYTQENERLTFDSRVTVDQQDKAASQSFKVTGSSGFVGLYSADAPQRSKQAVKSLRLEGPVNFELHSLTDVEDPDRPGTRVPRPFVVKGSGSLLTYDDSTRKMVLDKNVVIDGTHPTLLGQMKGVRAILTLDENWNPIEVEMVGEPGTTTVSERPPRGAKKA